MSMFAPVTAEGSRAEYALMRLARRYAASRSTGGPVLPPLVALAERLGATAEGAVAAASLFELTEAVLGRPLRTGRSCDPQPSADERALSLLLAHAPRAGPVHTTRAVPHGLPGVLVWAATCVRLALGAPAKPDGVPAACPFTAAPVQV